MNFLHAPTSPVKPVENIIVEQSDSFGEESSSDIDEKEIAKSPGF